MRTCAQVVFRATQRGDEILLGSYDIPDEQQAPNCGLTLTCRQQATELDLIASPQRPEIASPPRFLGLASTALGSGLALRSGGSPAAPFRFPDFGFAAPKIVRHIFCALIENI